MATENLIGGAFVLLVVLWLLRGWVRAPSRSSIIAALYVGGLLVLFTVAFTFGGVPGAVVALIITVAGVLLLRRVKQPERTDTEEALHTMATRDTAEIAEEIDRRNKD